MLSSTQMRLQLKLKKPQFVENSWEIAKVFIKFFNISLKDISKRYNREIKNLDELSTIPNLTPEEFTLGVINPIYSTYTKHEKIADAKHARAKAVKLIQLMNTLSEVIIKNNGRKFEIYLTTFANLINLFPLASDLLYNNETIPLDIQTTLFRSYVNFSKALREKYQIIEKDLTNDNPEKVLNDTCALYSSIAYSITILKPEWVDLSDNEIDAELENYKTFIKKSLWEKNKKAYFSEHESYLFCMAGLCLRKKDFESNRYYLLSMLQNARKGFAFDHAFSDAILESISDDCLKLEASLTKENIFSNDTAEEILFISRMMKELINKSIALQAKKLNKDYFKWKHLTAEQLNAFKNLFSNCNEKIKALLWEAMNDLLSKEDNELVKTDIINGNPIPKNTAVTNSEIAKNDPVNYNKYFTLTVIDPDFMPYLCRALQSCDMSYLVLEQQNTVRITNFYQHKLKQFPSALEKARLSFKQDKESKEKIAKTQLINLDINDNKQEKLNLPEVENSTATETSSSANKKNKKMKRKEKRKEKEMEMELKKPSAKAEAIISQNQNKTKLLDVTFTDTLKYCDNGDDNTIYPLRATKAHHIYATIDPALIKELESKNLSLPLEDLTTMLDVGHVLNNSKGLQGSILRGKPFNGEKQPPDKGLYLKVKNCSHDFRFFGYKTHEVNNGGVTCTLVTVNGWKKRHKKKSELFASIPEQLETKVKKSIKKKNNKKKTAKKKGR